MAAGGPLLVVTVILMPLLVGGVARAAERFEEVLVTDIAEPKRPGEVWFGLKTRLVRDGGDSVVDFPLHLEAGFVTNLGVEVSLPVRVAIPDDERAIDGFGDLTIGLAYDVLGGLRHPDAALALGVEAAFPSGRSREGFSEGKYEVGPTVRYDLRLGRTEAHAALEAGFTVATRPIDGERETGHEGEGGLALHHRLREGLGLVGEVDVGYAEAEDAFTTALVGGLWWEPLEWLEVGVGVEAPVGGHRTHDWGVVTALWIPLEPRLLECEE